LADGRGLIVPFAQSDSLAEATLRFLKDSAFQSETGRRAYSYAKLMFWPTVGRQYLDCFTRAALADDAAPRHASHSAFIKPGRKKRRAKLLREGL
jgi:hypothetical protein